MKKLLLSFIIMLFSVNIYASYILIPMDYNSQKNHLKAYGITYWTLEKQLKVNGMVKRYDVVIFNSDGTIKVLVECKAPEINITQNVFDQIARYNMQLQAEYLMVTNGLSHFYCEMDFQKEKYAFLRDIPEFSR